MSPQIDYSHIDAEAFRSKLSSILGPQESSNGSASFHEDALKSRGHAVIRGSQCIGTSKRNDDEGAGWERKRVSIFRNAPLSSYSSGPKRPGSTSPRASFIATPPFDKGADCQLPELQAMGKDDEDDHPVIGTVVDTDGDPAPIVVDALTSIMDLTINEIRDKILSLNRQIAQNKNFHEIGQTWKIRAEKAELDLIEAKTAYTVLEDRHMGVAGARTRAELKVKVADAQIEQGAATLQRMETELKHLRKAVADGSNSHLCSYLAHERKERDWELARSIAGKCRVALEKELEVVVNTVRQVESKAEKAKSEAAGARQAQKAAESKAQKATMEAAEAMRGQKVAEHKLALETKSHNADMAKGKKRVRELEDEARRSKTKVKVKAGEDWMEFRVEGLGKEGAAERAKAYGIRPM